MVAWHARFSRIAQRAMCVPNPCKQQRWHTHLERGCDVAHPFQHRVVLVFSGTVVSLRQLNVGNCLGWTRLFTELPEENVGGMCWHCIPATQHRNWSGGWAPCAWQSAMASSTVRVSVSRMVDASAGQRGSRTKSFNITPWIHTPWTLKRGRARLDRLLGTTEFRFLGMLHLAWSIPS